MKKIKYTLIAFFVWVGCDNLPPHAADPVIPTVPTTLGGGTVDVSGRVTDPATGNPRENVSVTITVSNGGLDYQASTTTNGTGDYSFTGVPDGTGSVQISYDGTLSTIDLTVSAATSTSMTSIDFSVPSANYSADKYIIVLTWGPVPLDLDSHLWVPKSPAYHLYYAAPGDRVGDLDISPFAGLDVDDVTSYGPETVTIKINNDNAYYAGTYKYWIYNYSGSPNMTTSQARVMVYRDGTLVKTYNIPTNGTTQRVWHVFNLNGNTITDVNTLQTTAPSSP